MEWLSLLLAAVLFAAACNLDTVILSMGYAVKGVRVSLSHSLIIAALTTLITWPSLLLGAGASRVLSGPLPNLLGGLVLVGIGAWFVLDWLRRLGPAGEAEGENRAATLWGCVSLAAALAHRPQLLILDEPANFVDNKFEKELYRTLHELNTHMAIVMVSHDIGTITSVVKEIVCVNRQVHRHRSNILTEEQLRNYDCPIQLVSHGHIPHTVLEHHPGDCCRNHE